MKSKFTHLMLLILLLVVACEDDTSNTDGNGDSTSLTLSNLNGSWKIIAATATEYQEGVGIVTPAHTDSNMLDKIITLDSAAKTGTFDVTTTFNFTLEGTVFTLTIPGDTDPPNVFNVTQFDGKDFIIANPVPTAHEQYSERQGNFLYNLNIWHLEKQ